MFKEKRLLRNLTQDMTSAETSYLYPSMLVAPTDVAQENVDVTPQMFNGFELDDLAAQADLKGKPDMVKIHATAKIAKAVQDAANSPAPSRSIPNNKNLFNEDD